MDRIKRQPTKVLLQAGQTQRSIGSSNIIQLQFQRDGMLLNIGNKHQQLIINLASVTGWHGAIIPPASNTEPLAVIILQLLIITVVTIANEKYGLSF